MNEDYKKAWERERKAREAAEQILEEKSRELYQSKLRASELNKELLTQQQENINTEKLAALGTLSAGIAHEINNPLAFIVSNIYVLKKNINQYSDLIRKLNNPSENDETGLAISLDSIDKKDKITADIFVEIEEGLDRVKDIVNNLKSYSRTTPQERIQFNPNEAIEAAVKICRHKIDKQCQIELNLGDIPKIYANFNELIQVFINLIINASQAIPESVNGSIYIESRTQGSSLIFICRDNGSGISEDNIKKIFNPFFTAKPVGIGTGLGLSVSQSIINGLGGKISLAETSKNGTSFKVSIPKEQRSQERS
jgi:C4-dicarboxylate-specific signal transduction histidine kinase